MYLQKLTKRIKDNQQHIGTLIKWGIFVLSLSFLYRELFLKRDFVQLLNDYGSRMQDNWQLLLLVVLLMPVNWGLEGLKWRSLMKPQVKVPFLRALAGTMAGVTVSILTPNRVGEFAGRMLFIRPDKRDHAVAMSLAGSISQLMITLLVGVVFGLLHTYQLDQMLWWYVPLAILLLAGILWLYFNLGRAERLLKPWKKNEFLHRAREVIGNLSAKKLSGALLWSASRYVIFSFQLALLIIALVDLAPHFRPVLLVIMVPMYFLYQTAVPTIAFSEIGVRGMILAVMFTEYAQESDLLLASTMLWIINIVTPALIGGVLLLLQRIKLFKT